MLFLLAALSQPADACSPGNAALLATFPTETGALDQRIRLVYGNGYWYNDQYELLVNGVAAEFNQQEHTRVLDMTNQHSVLLLDAVEEFPLGAQVELRNGQESLLRFSVEEVELASPEDISVSVWAQHLVIDNSDNEHQSECQSLTEIEQTLWIDGHPDGVLVEVYSFPAELEGVAPGPDDLEDGVFYQLLWDAEVLAEGQSSGAVKSLDVGELCFAARAVSGSETGKFGVVMCSVDSAEFVCGTRFGLGCASLNRNDLGWLCFPMALIGLLRRRN